MAQQPLRVEKLGTRPPADVVPLAHGPLVRLHVPDAPYRPGDDPCFSRFSEQPGDLDQPHALADYQQFRPHAHGLIRVLNDRGDVSGAWNPDLASEQLLRGLEWMARVRAFDTRLMTMQRQGRLSFYLSCQGEEAVAVAAAMALEKNDLLFPSYRQPGLFLVRGMTPVQMMCQCIGNQRDSCRGRQMPIHYSWRKGRVVSISSPVGTQFPQAVGAAMAMAIRGDTDVAAAWMGEGSTAQGDFHYALNFASVYEPPVVLNVVNNQWAISTPSNIASGGKSFAARAEAFGLPGLRVDGNDFLAVYAATAWAAKRARDGGGPTLIELVTYRAAAHSSSDDPSRYRPPKEALRWPGGDPIARLFEHLRRTGHASDSQWQEMQQRVRAEMRVAYHEAERMGSLAEGPFDPPERLVDDVYEQLPWHLKRQRDQLRAS